MDNMVKTGKGWFKHSREHALAAKGISTKNPEFRTKTPVKRPPRPVPKRGKNPLDEYNYGRMRTGGGYQSYTQMDVPANRIGEASHCILGSMSRQHNEKDWKRLELPHTEEETGLIKKYLAEGKSYSITREWKGDPYTKDSLMQIYYNSPRLRREASEALRDLDLHRDDIDPILYDVARNAYLVLISLADAMEQSVENGKMVRNPYYHPQLSQDINNLELSVLKWKNVNV